MTITPKKFYLPPPNNGSNFKELFKSVVASGIGRSIESEGFASGPWTPDLLAEAISQLDGNHAGVELRTVQIWFQDNDKGISPDNIRWLARVLGCDDPIKTSDWQKELSAANSRLTSLRRNRAKADAEKTKTENSSSQSDFAIKPKPRFSLATKSEAIFHGGGSLNLPVTVWACAVALVFMAFSLGLHSVTYSPVEGVNKQVGFFWSPAWMIEGLILMPFYLIYVAGLLTFWKDKRQNSIYRKICVNGGGKNTWVNKVESFSLAYWGILLTSFLVIFVLQWSAVYLRAFIQGPEASFVVDWITVTIVQSHETPVPLVLGVSIFAFLYSGLIYWLYFVGLLLLYTIVKDFSDLAHQSDDNNQKEIRLAGTKIIRGVFRCTILGILISVCIKLNSVFLKSDAENIVTWLVNDTLSVFDGRITSSAMVGVSALSSLTSFLLMLITAFVFFICIFQVYATVEASMSRKDKLSFLGMICVVVLLIFGFLLIGLFAGFSVLLACSLLIGMYSLTWRTQPRGTR